MLCYVVWCGAEAGGQGKVDGPVVKIDSDGKLLQHDADDDLVVKDQERAGSGSGSGGSSGDDAAAAGNGRSESSSLALARARGAGADDTHVLGQAAAGRDSAGGDLPRKLGGWNI